MSTAKIVWIVGVLAAIVFAFVSFEMAGLVIAILGLAGGFFVDKDHRLGLLAAAIFLAGGAGALNAIPTAGPILTDILTSYSGLLAAASVMAIARTTFDRLKP